MIIKDLTDNPGLYPLTLGDAILKKSDWTLIKIVDYSPILKNYDNLRLNLVKTIATLENQYYPMSHRAFKDLKDILINHNNQLLIIRQFINKADQLLNQLFPEFQINRKKRGLADGLGTVVKFITGNLNAEDGERYEKLINKLSQTSDSHNNALIEQARILNDTLSTIKDLSDNQKFLNDNLNKIILENDEIKQLVATGPVKGIINESIQSLQLFIDIWLQLETALTFAQNQQLHMSLIDNNDLLLNLNEISNLLNNAPQHEGNPLTIPYPATLENLHLYESIITTKVYQKGKIFTFIFEVPLVSRYNTFQLTELIPFPIHMKDNQFRMIIPSYNTILFNTKNSVPIDINHCKATSVNEYFCLQKNHFEIPNHKLCETQLLAFIDNQTCTPYVFSLTSIKISQINPVTFLLSTPTKVTLDIKCTQQKYRQGIIGSKLINLTPDCSILVNHAEILFSMKTSSTKIIDLKLPNIGQLQIPESEHINITKIDLIPINTRNLINHQIELTNQQNKLNLINSPLSHSLSISSIVITIFIIVIILSTIVIIICKRNSFKEKLLKILRKEKLRENVPIQLDTLLQSKT